jgi:hypothetical protein
MLLVGKPERKRLLGRPIRRWIDNIKTDILEIGLNVVEWIGLAKDRYRCRALVNSVMNLRDPYNSGKLPSGCTTCGLSCGTQLHRVSLIMCNNDKFKEDKSEQGICHAWGKRGLRAGF